MRGGSVDGNPIGIGVRKSILLPCAISAGAFLHVRLAGAFENMLEHLCQGEAGVVCLVEQNQQRDSQHDGENPEARQRGGASFPG